MGSAVKGVGGGVFSVSELRAPRSALARYAPPAERRRSIANEKHPASHPLHRGSAILETKYKP